jgi:hypothetical protein
MLIIIEITILALIILSYLLTPILTIVLLVLLILFLLIQPSDWYRWQTSPKTINKATMRAVVYDLSSPSGFKLEENHSLPKYSANQVLVKVMAAAINPVDYKLIFAKIPFLRWLWPKTVGRDVSGVVLEVGENVTKFKAGDKVFGKPLKGALQEFTVADQNEIALKPHGNFFSKREIINKFKNIWNFVI